MAKEGNTFHLVIASVGETRFDGPAVSATIPTTAGVITVLPHHAPIVSTLRSGDISVKDSQGEVRSFPVESGVIEVSGNRAVILL